MALGRLVAAVVANSRHTTMKKI